MEGGGRGREVERRGKGAEMEGYNVDGGEWMVEWIVEVESGTARLWRVAMQFSCQLNYIELIITVLKTKEIAKAFTQHN